jgi:DNA-binding transcriptional LysR family regulator
LQNNEIDLAILLHPKQADTFDIIPLFEDELAFVLAPDHPWVTSNLARAEIPKQNYILYQKNSYTQRLVEDYFKQEKMVLNTVMELGSMDGIKELVKLGLGVSILAPWLVEKELQEKSLVALPLGKRRLKRSWVIASRKGRRLSIAEETFIKMCGAFTSKMTTMLPPTK